MAECVASSRLVMKGGAFNSDVWYKIDEMDTHRRGVFSIKVC